MRICILGLVCAAILACADAAQAQCPSSYPYSFSANTSAVSSQVNSNFTASANCWNGGTLTNGTLAGTTALPGSGVITSGGNVGIGTTSPGSGISMSGGLTINGTGSTQLSIQNGGANAFALNASSGAWTVFDYASGSWISSITSKNGNVGVGTSNPQTNLQVYESSSDSIFNVVSGGKAISLYANSGQNPAVYWDNSDPLRFGVSPTGGASGGGGGFSELMRITASGNVGIGTSTPGYPLAVNGTAYATGAAGALSDARYKKDIAAYAEDALKQVEELKPVTFLWKDPRDDGMKGPQIGFIAQDVQNVVPETILTMHDDEKTLGIKYDALIPVLTKAIQQQQAEIDELKQSLREITVINGNLEAKIDDIRRVSLDKMHAAQ